MCLLLKPDSGIELGVLLACLVLIAMVPMANAQMCFLNKKHRKECFSSSNLFRLMCEDLSQQVADQYYSTTPICIIKTG